MNKLRDFSPRAVYFCDCLQETINNCSKSSSLQDICNEIDDSDSDDKMIYCVRCGDGKQDVVFSCGNHLMMGTIELHGNNVTLSKFSTGYYCLSCIKKYLQEKYYKFNCQIFNRTILG